MYAGRFVEEGLASDDEDASGNLSVRLDQGFLVTPTHVPLAALDAEQLVHVLEVDTESNAILFGLAEGTPYLPTDGWERAQALSWMFFEQYSHEPCVAVARFIRGWTDADSPRRAELPRLHERAATALAVMEQHLRQAQWFTGSEYGIADIALFAYTDVAADGGIDLQPFVEVRAWLQRVREQPRFVAMPAVTPEVRARLDSRG